MKNVHMLDTKAKNKELTPLTIIAWLNNLIDILQ